MPTRFTNGGDSITENLIYKRDEWTDFSLERSNRKCLFIFWMHLLITLDKVLLLIAYLKH
jgi:hypothetical protein